MKVTITSKNSEKIFNDSNVINIGTAPNCNYKLDLGFDLVFSLQKLESGKWQIVNTSKSNKILFSYGYCSMWIRNSEHITKLYIYRDLETQKYYYLTPTDNVDTDEFIGIKITAAGTNPKVVPGSLELANRKNAERIKRAENKRTISMIEDEDLNEQDIEALYGTGIGAQAKIKIDRRKADIERRRALITKEIAYKANYLRNKLGQNELILAFLNFFIVFVPFAMAFILKDIIRSIVVEFGGERPENVIITDIPDTIVKVVKWRGKAKLYFYNQGGYKHFLKIILHLHLEDLHYDKLLEHHHYLQVNQSFSVMI